MLGRIVACALLLSVIAGAACSDEPAASPPAGPGGSAGTANDASADAPADTVTEALSSDAAGDAQADAERPSGPGQARVVECPGWPMPTLDTGVCTASGSGNGPLLLRGTVLAPNAVLRGGELLIAADGVILCAACGCSSRPEAANAALVTCPRGVISPGLINTHDHITFAGSGPVDHGDLRYEHRHDWRLGIRQHAALTVPDGASENQILGAELRGILAGTTSTIGGGGSRGLLRNLDVADLKEGLFVDTVESDTFPLDDASGILQSSGCGYGASPTSSASIASLNAYVAHVAEGIDPEARNELACAGPSAFDLLKPQTAVVHGIAAGAREAATLAEQRAWLVWSPRSNIDLYGNTAPVTLYDRLGVGIALGTDWLASGSMNLLREFACAEQLNQRAFAGHFSDFALWRMVTTNAAFAAGVERGLGLLAPGQVADVAVFDGAARTDHRAVIAAEPAGVALVLRGGRALYGDRDLMASAALGGAGCEALDVCGAPKLVCAAADTGVPLADIVSAAEAVLPLFFCGSAAPEPTCVPRRPGEYDGNASAGDRDGDGVPDASDRCPEFFDPPRPLDQGQQADSDGDGLGDACDPCPLEAGAACTPPSVDDVDRDGIANGSDNCPDTANPDQLDGDGDGHGDACDDCAAPNPGFLPCTLPLPTDLAH